MSPSACRIVITGLVLAFAPIETGNPVLADAADHHPVIAQKHAKLCLQMRSLRCGDDMVRDTAG